MGEINENYMNFFRLCSLKVSNHPILGNIHLNFCQELLMPNEVYTSVIIGANGIGKSYLLRLISDIFCCLEQLKNNSEPKVPRCYFEIKFVSQGEMMSFANFREINAVGRNISQYNQFVFLRNGEKVDVRDIVIPKRVIASSTTIADKYVAKSTDMYRYKGLRNEKSPSMTGTRTMVRKTVDSLLGSLDMKYGFRRELKELLEHLGLQPRLELTYNLRYKQVFINEHLSTATLIHIFEHQELYFGNRKTKLWGSHNFKRIKEEEIWKLDCVAIFFRRLAQQSVSQQNHLKYDLLAENERVSEDKEALNVLSQLDLLTYPMLKVYKKDDGGYNFDQSSSGESSILCQMVSIMSDIEPNSLILIDEPEVSAHPNWQINYLGWLKKIFQRYFNCHFVISTHSHFLLTDLEPKTSDIIALEKGQDGIIKDVSVGINTFNWTVDDILYRVFHVRNTRNSVFESKMIELYRQISNQEQDKTKVMTLIDELSRYQLNNEDPLVKLLDTARNYVKS